MNTSHKPHILIIAIGCIGALLVPRFATGSASAQTVTVVGCPTTKAALHTDIANAGNGGTVTLSCPSATTITFPTPITITRNVTLDASGSPGAITLSGHGKTHLFNINAGDKFTVNGLILSHGHVSAGHTNDGKGGAIYNHKGDLAVTDSTFSGNSGAQGGAIYNNGGPTQTMALKPTSPAIDKIPLSTGDCPKTDQRGVTRPDNGEAFCDIGAYEYVDKPAV